MSQRKINLLLKRAKKIKSEIENVKKLYYELDEIISELKALKFKSNKKARIIDNFKNKQKAFKTVSFSRFDIDFE